MPEAGGYVANGKVVSKSPQYDEAGKLKLDVDAALFQPQVQPISQSQNVQTANNPITNNGITTANTTGSGEDVNSMATQIGANTSLNLNTANPMESVLSTPATKSPVAEEPILTPVDQALKEIQDAAARNDLQGEINGYVKLSNLTGVDYTNEINSLTKARGEKIKGVDDNYVEQLRNLQAQRDQALATGDIETATALQSQITALQGEQQSWRDMVGYEDAMKQSYDMEVQALYQDYIDTFQKTRDDITNGILQMVGNYMNFQYDPYQDSALRIAQQYATSAVKEQANSTGMYYSSQTQNAIARAVAELVPVYEKMAKEEMREKISLLQSTANYLMNLSEFQFNMWKSQIQMQWAAKDEERKLWQDAYDQVNLRGYVTNQEAAILGLAPGTLSPDAQKRLLDKQDQIEKEQRDYEQSVALERVKNELDLQKYEEQLLIDKKYGIKEFAPKTTTSRSGSGGSGGSGSGALDTSDLTDEDIAWLNGLIDGESGEWSTDDIESFLMSEFNGLDDETAQARLTALMNYYVLPTIDDYVLQFGDDKKGTKAAWSDAQKFIEKFGKLLSYTNLAQEDKDYLTSAAWQRLEQGKEAFDTNGYTPTAKENQESGGLKSAIQKANNFIKKNSITETNFVKNALSNAGYIPGATYAPVIQGEKQNISSNSAEKAYIKSGQKYILGGDGTDKPENYIFVAKDGKNRYYYKTNNTSDGQVRTVYVDNKDVKNINTAKVVRVVTINDDGSIKKSKSLKANSADMLNVRVLTSDPTTGSYYYFKY